MRLVLATGNAGKIKEFKAAFADLNINFVLQNEFNIAEADETGLSYIENALIKARHASQCTGLPALADDSGVEVEALGGAPGIYSARYAGEKASAEENNTKLLQVLGNNPQRNARFQCVLVYLQHALDPN